VNAVLRKIADLRGETVPRPGDWASQRRLIPLGDGRVRLLTGDAFPGELPELLPILTSHPRWLADRWIASHGPDRAAALALHGMVSQPTTLNTAFHRSPLPESLTPHGRTGHHTFLGSRRELAELLASRSDIWVQDAASSVAVDSARELRPSIVLDLCAGQGTKTRQLAAAFPHARIIATDVDASRFRSLEQLWKGHAQVDVLPMHAATQAAAGAADLILLDVPCSNTGVLARRTEAKYRCNARQLGRLITIQRDIITAAAPLLSPTGRLLYSTCSIEPEENQGQARWAADRFGLVIERSTLLLPSGLPGDPPKMCHDGSFSAVLLKPR
jgi:16S rRNA (cytosine967-C5)-methyltransferase